MTLKNEMMDHIDGNDLASNEAVPIGVKRASDNGVLHTSRYLILQKLHREPLDVTCLQALHACIDAQGYLHRAPDDPDEDVPDDHYGIVSLFAAIGLQTNVKLPWRCLHPALLFMRGLQRGGFEGLYVRLFSPVVAILIALSNWSEPLGDTSDRLLTWNLIQGTQGSVLCRLGALVWEARQNYLYGGSAIRKIAKKYYPNSPLADYFII